MLAGIGEPETHVPKHCGPIIWFALGAPPLVAGAPSPESRATISPSLVRLAPGDIGLGCGSEAGQFTDPRFATVDSGGKIYVTDVKGDRPRIQVFDRNGKFLHIPLPLGERRDQPRRVQRASRPVYGFQRRRIRQWLQWSDAEVHLRRPLPARVCLRRPPDGLVYFHSLTGDKWGNVFVTVRTKAGYEGALESNVGKKVSMAKYNNNGDFISTLRLSAREHSESWSVVDGDGTVYALFNGRTESGVEIFAEE
jgi:hypothetical protein